MVTDSRRSTTVCRGTRALGVRWRNGENGAETSFSHVWLRDNCMCPECLHPKTLQRQIDTLKARTNCRPFLVAVA
jgi:rubredoxin